MKSLNKISTRLILPIALATIVFSLVLYIVAGSTIGQLMERNLERLGRSKMVDINSSEKRISEAMLAQASIFSEQEAIQAAYKTAYQGNLNDANDPYLDKARNELRQFFTSVGKGYTKNMEGQSLRLHFHVPPARSLLRVWRNNQKKSDDLTPFRETITTISNNQKPVVGVEVGRVDLRSAASPRSFHPKANIWGQWNRSPRIRRLSSTGSAVTRNRLRST